MNAIDVYLVEHPLAEFFARLGMHDTFAAMGNREQFIIIALSMNAVIVRRGEDPPGHRSDIFAFTRMSLNLLQNRYSEK